MNGAGCVGRGYCLLMEGVGTMHGIFSGSF